MSVASAVSTSAAEVGVAVSVYASAPSKSATATSAEDGSSSPPSSSAKSAAMSAAIEPTTTTATASAPAPLIAASSSSVSAAADSSSSSSSSSSAVEVAAALKKCSLCQRSLPDSDYSGAQLKAKAKRQCKVCVAALQSARAGLPPGEAIAVPQNVGTRIVAITSRLNNPAELEQRIGLRDLAFVLSDYEKVGIHLQLEAAIIARVLSLLRDGPSNELCLGTLFCVRLMARQPQLTGAMVDAGAIPVALALLGRADLSPSCHVLSIGTLRGIIEASRANCDTMLAAGVLAVLLPLIHPGISLDMGKELLPLQTFREQLFLLLSDIMSGRPASEMAAVVARIGTSLMEGDAPQKHLYTCLNTFLIVLHSFADGDPNLVPWVESILSAAPGMPRRLVDLLGDRGQADVAEVALVLIRIMFNAKTDQLRLLFDCGLLDRLPPLLNDANDGEARLRATDLCSHAASIKIYAQLLVDSAPIIQPLLALLPTSEGEMLHHAVAFFCNATSHLNRHMTRRLVDEHLALPPLVTALRRAIQMEDQTATFRCLGAVANVLVVGDAEAEDDDRGINPYIEPLDFQLGAFELVEPLQNHSDAATAEVARRVYSYFIPNDCE